MFAFVCVFVCAGRGVGGTQTHLRRLVSLSSIAALSSASIFSCARSASPPVCAADRASLAVVGEW